MEYQIVTKTGTVIKQFGSLFLAKEYVQSWVNNRAGKLTSQGGWVIRDIDGRIYDPSDESYLR